MNADKGYVFTSGIPLSGHVNIRGGMVYNPYWLGFVYTTNEHEYLIYCFYPIITNADTKFTNVEMENDNMPATIFYI